jgi:hypothetical protein
VVCPRRRPWALLVASVLVAVACSGGDDGDLVAFCARVVDVPVITSREQIGSGGPDADVLAGVIRRLENVEEVAPDEVADDVHTLVETVEVLNEALATEDDVSADASAVADARASIETRRAAYALASDRIVDYAQASCGVELEPAG